ncbi:ATP-binding protein [Natronoflexus pectinivorans]|nr:ATP-binding protein [Natronoflexus pectinivorans]
MHLIVNATEFSADSVYQQFLMHQSNKAIPEIIELAEFTSSYFPLSKNDSLNLFNHINQNAKFKEFLILCTAIHYEHKLNPDLAIKKYNQLLNVPDIEKEMHTYTLRRLFHLHSNQNNLEKSQEICLKLLDIYQTENNHHGLAQAHLHMARIYLRLRNLNHAMHQLDIAYEYAKLSNDNQLLLSVLFAIGAAHLMDSNYSIAKEHFIKIIEHPETPSIQYGHAAFNMASIFIQNNEYDKAIDFLNQSLKIYIELNDSTRISNVKNNLAQIYNRTKNFSEAIKNLYSVADFAKNTNNEELLSNVYYNLLQTFINLNQPDSALLYLDKYIDLNSELWKDQQAAHILELEKQYQFENQQRQIELLKAQDELQKASFRNILIILFVIAILSILFFIGGVTFFRQKQRIRKSHSKLLARDKEIHRINVELNQSNLAKDRILSIIGHDLRGPIGSLRDLSGFYAVNPHQTEEEILDYLKMSHESSTSLYYLLDNLLAWANSQKGNIHFSSEKIQLKPVVHQVVKLLDVSLNQKQLSFEVSVPSDVYVFADVQMLKTILRNLISNSIKFSAGNTRITISASINIKTGFAEISVEDQGIGISANQLESLFAEKETFFLQKSGDAGGTGLGLILCKEFVEMHRGTIWACSQPKKGTKICFTLPTYIPETTKSNDSLISDEQMSKFSS